MEAQPRIKTLKAQADQLGIKYSPNIGPDTLDARIKQHLAQATPLSGQVTAPVAPTVTPEENEAMALERKIKAATRLIRIIATPMDQRKNDGERQGEYVMGGNSVVGTYKKFIPYGQPVHIEQLLLNVLEEKKFQQRYGKGNQQSREVKEFAIQILPDLTPTEVQELKKMQAIRAESANAEM